MDDLVVESVHLLRDHHQEYKHRRLHNISKGIMISNLDDLSTAINKKGGQFSITQTKHQLEYLNHIHKLKKRMKNKK